MANEHGLFWTSQNGDRVYDANDFSEWLKKFYTTGVFNGDLAVTASGGMTVSVSSGYVNIEGKVKLFSTPTTLTIATAGGTYERIDTVVAECNYSDREITVKVVTGAYSTSPTATAPVRTVAAYQLVLAQIDVPAGATEITQKNITDKRMDSNVCGLVTGTVSQIDFSTVKAQFDSWFEDVKGTFDSDAAGNLKNQIDAANEKINTNTNNLKNQIDNLSVKVAGAQEILQDQIDKISAQGAGAHNSIYRGKNLGTSVTDKQWAVINAGTFDDLYIGDYWVINGETWRIAAFDYFLYSGDTECTTHHAVIVPDECLYNAQMNTKNDTAGGYVAVKTRGVLATTENTIKAAFSASHILSHRVYLTNAVANGKPSGGAWVDTICDLMNEEMVYGTGIFRPTSDGSTISGNPRIEKSQLPLFTHEPSRINNHANYWLRDVVEAARFAMVSLSGYAGAGSASVLSGIRPVFSIKS